MPFGIPVAYVGSYPDFALQLRGEGSDLRFVNDRVYPVLSFHFVVVELTYAESGKETHQFHGSLIVICGDECRIVAHIVDVAEDGESFTFKPNAKKKYFHRQYYAFLDKARELTGISIEAFCAETPYDIGMAMYKLNEAYQDKFSFYIYYQDELKTLDEWIRETDLSESFYFGGTLDYHF